jgi:hypothetical protein
MNIAVCVSNASVLWHHRPTVGDGQIMLEDAKIGLCSPALPLCAHPLSCPIGAIPVARSTADLIRVPPFSHTNNRLDSNPHSAMPPLASCQSARGFLPRGLSDAYRRPL